MGRSEVGLNDGDYEQLPELPINPNHLKKMEDFESCVKSLALHLVPLDTHPMMTGCVKITTGLLTDGKRLMLAERWHNISMNCLEFVSIIV